MTTRILKRFEVAHVLREWHEGRMSTEQLLRWADA
jgi:hypothetical protein